VVHIDNTYVRGNKLDIEALFAIVDVTHDVLELQDAIPHRLQEFEDVLSDKTDEPDIDIGAHCNKPYECDTKEYCWRVQREIPEYSVFSIFNLGSKKQVALYEQGIVDIKDIPDDFEMTNKPKQYQTTKQRRVL